MMTVKIFYLTNLLSPYRIEWMNMLSLTHQIEAYYLEDNEVTREKDWLTYIKPMFKTKRASAYKLYPNTPSRSFMRVLDQQSYDVNIIDGYSSQFKLKVLKKLVKQHQTVLINIDGIDIWRQRTIADIFKDRIKQRVYRSGAYFTCGSRIAADAVINGGADPEKVFVHPFTSIHESDIIAPGEKRELQERYKKELGCEGKKIVLAVGRFIPLKRYDCLIRAWKDMPVDCRLFIIGGGELREEYENIIKESDIHNIELMDFLLPEKLSEYFCAADLFVHPSSTETWGLVINEAMAKGCPVIATDRCVGGVELIREGEEGYLIPVGDEEALRDRMLTVLNDDSLRESMSAKAIERIRPYTYENLLDTHLKLLDKITKGKG